MVSITSTPIDISAILATVATSHAQGVDVFINTVRSHSHGRRIEAMEYTTNVQRAKQMMTEIEHVMRQRWLLQSVILVHRIGVLYVGQVSLVAAVSASNSAGAFEACRYAIDAIETVVPFEKAEFLEEGLAWVVGQHDVDVVGMGSYIS